MIEVLKSLLKLDVYPKNLIEHIPKNTNPQILFELENIAFINSLRYLMTCNLHFIVTNENVSELYSLVRILCKNLYKLISITDESETIIFKFIVKKIKSNENGVSMSLQVLIKIQKK